MTNQTRLETILKMLLHQKTGSLEPPAKTFNDRVENLAHHLVDEGVIVLVGELHPSQRAELGMHLQLWMHTYTELYYLLNNGLYNSTDAPVAYLADRKYPLVVVFEAKTLIVVRVMTNLIIPYIALRQENGGASRAELRGIVDNILDELGATNIHPEKKQVIRKWAIQYLETLLKSEITQVSLTNFSQEFLIETGLTHTRMKETKRPDTIPGLNAQKAGTQPAPTSPDNIIPLPPLHKRDDEQKRNGLRGLLNRNG